MLTNDNPISPTFLLATGVEVKHKLPIAAQSFQQSRDAEAYRASLEEKLRPLTISRMRQMMKPLARRAITVQNLTTVAVIVQQTMESRLIGGDWRDLVRWLAEYSGKATPDQAEEAIEEARAGYIATEKAFERLVNWANSKKTEGEDVLPQFPASEREIAERSRRVVRFLYVPLGKMPPLSAPVMSEEEAARALGDYLVAYLDKVATLVPLRRAHVLWDQIEKIRLRLERVEAGADFARGDDTLEKRLARAEKSFDKLFEEAAAVLTVLIAEDRRSLQRKQGEAVGLDDGAMAEIAAHVAKTYDPRLNDGRNQNAFAWMCSRFADAIALCRADMGAGKTHMLREALRNGTLAAALRATPRYQKIRLLGIFGNHEMTQQIVEDWKPEFDARRATVYRGPEQLWIDGVTPMHDGGGNLANLEIARKIGFPVRALCACGQKHEDEEKKPECHNPYCRQPQRRQYTFRAGAQALELSSKDLDYFDLIVIDDLSCVSWEASETYSFKRLEGVKPQTLPSSFSRLRGVLRHQEGMTSEEITGGIKMVGNFVARLRAKVEAMPVGYILKDADMLDLYMGPGETTVERAPAYRVWRYTRLLKAKTRRFMVSDGKWNIDYFRDATKGLSAVAGEFGPWLSALNAVIEVAGAFEHRLNDWVLVCSRDTEGGPALTVKKLPDTTCLGLYNDTLVLNTTEDPELLRIATNCMVKTFDAPIIEDFGGVIRHAVLADTGYRVNTPPKPERYMDGDVCRDQYEIDLQKFVAHAERQWNALRMQAFLYGTSGIIAPLATAEYMTANYGVGGPKRHWIDGKVGVLSASVAVGSNFLADVGGMMDVGRSGIKPAEVEGTAALFGGRNIQQIGGNWFPIDDIGDPNCRFNYRHLRGGGGVKFPAMYHPDPMVERVRLQVFEMLKAQTMRRDRANRSRGRRVLEVFNFSTLDDSRLYYDHVYPDRGWYGQFREEGVFMALGFLPLREPRRVFGAVLGLTDRQMSSRMGDGTPTHALWEIAMADLERGRIAWPVASFWNVNLKTISFDNGPQQVELAVEVALAVEAGDTAAAVRHLDRLGVKFTDLKPMDRVYRAAAVPTVPNDPLVTSFSEVFAKGDISMAKTSAGRDFGTVGTPDVTVGTGTLSKRKLDPLDALSCSGAVPPLGVKGYAELAAFVTGIKPKTVRNKVTLDGDLKARWKALVPNEADCSHRVTIPGGAFSVPAKLTEEGVELLRLRGCTVVGIGPQTPPDIHDGPGGGDTPETGSAANDTNRDGSPAPAPFVLFADPAAARAAHMMRDALGLAELIAAGTNDLELVGFTLEEQSELLEMAREIARKRSKSL